MSAERLIANLLRIADQDLKDARLLASQGSRNAFYLCEQAAEKLIKAVLTSENVNAGIRHLLDDMVTSIPDENPLKASLRSLEHLAAFATSYRYPTSSGRIPRTPANIGEELTRVGAVLDELVERFAVDLAAQDAPAGNANPIRSGK